ncbi:hypothetical protein RHGRI_005756 [Rhododendron griersonianum]|uniref:Peptidase A1 domain-containing protein n=1 Tax=Rhododendron griersonianum TaxID=479676 RepID=A0AAV6LGS7_9ERIC|nr:hypothetical protein RHGRI_005756 [Rhododendron griersonianum]
MSHDQARVNSLQIRLRPKSDHNSLDDVKATVSAKTGRSIGGGNYIVTLGLGTPQKDLTLTFDTGSDVTWIQCQPCIRNSGFWKRWWNHKLRWNKIHTLIDQLERPSFYFIEVTGIKVDGELLPISQSVFSSSGTIIDSGTVITRLQPAAYDALRTRFRQLMMNYTMTSGVSLFDTCYNFSGRDTVEVPEISFLFAGEIEVPIAVEGILYKVDSSMFCLAFAGNEDASDAGIFGNVQQQTLEVVYDVAGGKLGFRSGGCAATDSNRFMNGLVCEY